MPECQAGYFLQHSNRHDRLTSWLLAYQMPSLAIFDPSWRSILAFCHSVPRHGT